MFLQPTTYYLIISFPRSLRYALTRKGSKGLQHDVDKCVYNAKVLKDMLEEAGFKAMLNELSNTVVFERPQEEALVRRWQLACEGDIAHIIVMPNHDIETLKEFVQDYVSLLALLIKWPEDWLMTSTRMNQYHPAVLVYSLRDLSNRTPPSPLR